MTPFAKRAEAHLRTLRRQYEIKRVWCKSWRRAYASVSTRTIHCPTARTGVEYLINLHEMGHVVSSTARRYTAFPSTDIHAEMMREAAAWAWAIMHADPVLLLEIPERDWNHVAWCLITYMQSAAGMDVDISLPEGGLLD